MLGAEKLPSTRAFPDRQDQQVQFGYHAVPPRSFRKCHNLESEGKAPSMKLLRQVIGYLHRCIRPNGLLCQGFLKPHTFQSGRFLQDNQQVFVEVPRTWMGDSPDSIVT